MFGPSPSRRRWVTLWGVIGGAVVLIVVIVQLSRQRHGLPATDSARPVEFQAGSFEGWENPAQSPVAEIIAQTKQVTQREAQRAGLPAPEALADRVSERVDLAILPQFYRWVELANGAGADVSAMFDKDGGLVDASIDGNWFRANMGLDGAPVAPEHITIRKIAPGTPISMNVPGTRFMRGYAQGPTDIKYPQPPANDPSLVLAEALVPVKFKSVGSSTHDLPATFTIRLYRTDSRPEWQPYDFFLYFDEASMGKELAFPIF